MITLNTERGFVTVNNWDEVAAIPGFTVDVEEKGRALEEVIGSYSLSKEINCGLNICRQPHKKGYIVKFNDGLITNIGKQCGKKRVGIDFQSLTKKHNTAKRDFQRRQTIIETQQRLPMLSERLKSLLNDAFSAIFLRKQLRTLMNHEDMPREAIQMLRKMARDGNGRVEKSRPMTDTEYEQHIAMKNVLSDKPDQPPTARSEAFISEKIGEISNINVLDPLHDLNTILIKTIKTKIDTIANSDPHVLKSSELRSISQCCEGLDKDFELAKTVIRNCRKFLHHRNLDEVASLPLKEIRDIERLKSTLKLVKGNVTKEKAILEFES